MTHKELEDKMMSFFDSRLENFYKSIKDADEWLRSLPEEEYKYCVDFIHQKARLSKLN